MFILSCQRGDFAFLFPLPFLSLFLFPSTGMGWWGGSIGGKREGITHPPTPRRLKKVVPSQTNSFIITVSPSTIFVQNCQKIAAFRQLSINISGFVFYSPSFPPQKGRTCTPPWGSKNHSPQNFVDPPHSCQPHAHLWAAGTHGRAPVW